MCQKLLMLAFLSFIDTKTSLDYFYYVEEVLEEVLSFDLVGHM